MNVSDVKISHKPNIIELSMKYENILQLMKVNEKEGAIAKVKESKRRKWKRKPGRKVACRRNEGLKDNSQVVENQQESKLNAANARNLCCESEQVVLSLKIFAKEMLALKLEVYKVHV